MIRGLPWQPLQPTTVERHAQKIIVGYHVPVGPLVWDTTFSPPHASVPQWKQGRGFEVTNSDGAKIMISSVAIAGDSIVITFASEPGANARISYATVGEETEMTKPFSGTKRWGLLHDSDPFVGSATGKAQSNYSVAFELKLP